jgi:hypothetical protein
MAHRAREGTISESGPRCQSRARIAAASLQRKTVPHAQFKQDRRSAWSLRHPRSRNEMYRKVQSQKTRRRLQLPKTRLNAL